MPTEATTATDELKRVDAGGNTFDIEAATVATAPDLCATGKVSKGVSTRVDDLTNKPNTTFVDTVIITATPI